MQSQTLTPFDLFGNQVRYTVPLFQRPYVWTRDRQWEPLWEDVRTVAERLLEAKEAQGLGGHTTEAIPHFLGAIVLDQKLVPTGFIQERQVIDGQQRLTTLQLLLDAAQEVVAAHGTESDAAALRGLIMNDRELTHSPDQVFKVWPTNYDREAFEAAMTDEVGIPDGLADSSIVKAHQFFGESISTWAELTGDPDKVRVRLNALASALRQYLRLVVIDLESGDNAQVIFETLNHRGTPLLAADLIKNAIFRQAESDGLDVEQLYESSWKRFDSKHWRKEIVQGRLRKPRVDVFFNYWLVMRTGREVPADRIFTDFSDYVRASNADLESTVGDLNHHASVFEQFDQFPSHSLAGTFVYRVLQVLDQGVMAPVLLWLFGQPEDVYEPGQKDKALQALESWAVRRMICRWTTRAVNRTIIDLVELLVASGPRRAGDEVVKFLLSKEGEAAGWPTDQDVVGAIEVAPLYKAITRARLRMLLEALEDDRRTPKSEEEHCHRWRLTIEHIMPQGWREHWHLPGFDHPEVESSRRDSLVHTLGNLTLVNNKLNPALSNRPWTDPETSTRGLGDTGKRSIIDDNSVLLLNHDIIQQHVDAWSEDSVTERGRHLGHRIITIWPRGDV